MSNVRETLEKALEDSNTLRSGWPIKNLLRGAIIESLSALEQMERDHEAMDELRLITRHSHGWRLIGGDLIQVNTQDIISKRRGYRDPARAILGQEGESNGTD